MGRQMPTHQQLGTTEEDGGALGHEGGGQERQVHLRGHAHCMQAWESHIRAQAIGSLKDQGSTDSSDLH